MRYRIAQVALVIFGLFFAVGALNVAGLVRDMGQSTAYFLGSILGHVLFAGLAALCFIGFKRAGAKATLSKQPA